MADSPPKGRSGNPAVDARAAAFVESRLAGKSLAAFPGAMPATVEVGRINPPWDSQFGVDRLAGPIFSRQLAIAGEGAGTASLFSGGFGAVEGEIVIEVAADAPAGKMAWTIEETIDFIGVIRLGMEIASSPFAGINDYGPLVTISDFGNNNGLILGAEIPGWRTASPADWQLRTLVDGVVAGASDAASIPGGPAESLRALLEICARIGLPLRRGMQVTTGAVTGVHPLRAGQTASVEMIGLPPIVCHAVPAPHTQSHTNPA